MRLKWIQNLISWIRSLFREPEATQEVEPLTLESDLREPSPIHPQRLDAHFAGTPMDGLGEAFVKYGQIHQVNALFLAALAVLESGWGRSRIAQNKNNLFGFGAFDQNPYESAWAFSSFEEGIDRVAGYISKEYLSPAGRHYHGHTLKGMSTRYSTNPGWGEQVLTLTRQLSRPSRSQ